MMSLMGNFRRDNNGGSRFGGDRGGGRSFGGGGGRGFGRGDDRPREMFKTVCSNCGKDCEVPFRPTTGKPVYCSECFEKVGGRSSDGGRSERPSFDRPQAPRSDSNKAQFDELVTSLSAVNAKLDRILKSLEPKIEEVKETPVLIEERVKVVKTPKVKKSTIKKIKKEESV